MRVTLAAVFVILIALSIGTYYTYRTDKTFESFVNSFLQKPSDAPVDTVKTSNLPSQQVKPDKKSYRPKRIKQKIERDKYYKLDSFARNVPKEYEKDIETLVNYLITPAKSEMEKARVLFTWVATHVHYDDDAFNSGNITASTAEKVLLTKKAVCDGYSTLLYELCVEAGLEAEKVSGFAKGYGYTKDEEFKEPDHAWNIIKIENQWKLFDSTWASGYGMNVNGKMVSVDEFDPYWFDLNPKEFIYTHFPEDPKWQLLQDTLTMEKFKALPYIPRLILN